LNKSISEYKKMILEQQSVEVTKHSDKAIFDYQRNVQKNWKFPEITFKQLALNHYQFIGAKAEIYIDLEKAQIIFTRIKNTSCFKEVDQSILKGISNTPLPSFPQPYHKHYGDPQLLIVEISFTCTLPRK
jgi:hypothetical protein